MDRRQFRSPHPVLPHRRSVRLHQFLSRHQLLLLLFTLVVVLSGVIGGTSLILIRSSAASLGVLPAAASNLTFQQFLKQG